MNKGNFSSDMEDKNAIYDAGKSRERNPLDASFITAGFFIMKCNEVNFTIKTTFLIQ